MEKNIRFMYCLKLKVFAACLTCYLIVMALMNLLLYGLATFFTVLLDPYLGQLIYIKAPLVHLILLSILFAALYIKALLLMAIYRWN